MNEMTIKESWKYVCNNCYRASCDCNTTRIGLDPLIIPLVRLSNEKNYQTIGSCEGHITTYERNGKQRILLTPAYLTFDLSSLQDLIYPIPCELQKEKGRYQLTFKPIKLKSIKEAKELKEKHLEILEKYIKSLPVRERKEKKILTAY